MKRSPHQVRTCARERPIKAFIRSVPGTLSLTASVYVGLTLPAGFPELLLLITLCTVFYVLMRVPVKPAVAADD